MVAEGSTHTTEAAWKIIKCSTRMTSLIKIRKTVILMKKTHHRKKSPLLFEGVSLGFEAKLAGLSNIRNGGK